MNAVPTRQDRVQPYTGRLVHEDDISNPSRWFINITMIDTTSVLVLFYLLEYHSIHNPPLICTSCGDSKFDLPSLYNLTEYHLFLPNISSLIWQWRFEEFLFPFFHCHVDGIVFHSNSYAQKLIYLNKKYHSQLKMSRKILPRIRLYPPRIKCQFTKMKLKWTNQEVCKRSNSILMTNQPSKKNDWGGGGRGG